MDEPQPVSYFILIKLFHLQNSATGMHSAIISFIENVRKISKKNLPTQ